MWSFLRTPRTVTLTSVAVELDSCHGEFPGLDWSLPVKLFFFSKQELRPSSACSGGNWQIACNGEREEKIYDQ